MPNLKVFVTTAGNDEWTCVRAITATREKAIKLLESDGYIHKTYAHGPDFWWDDDSHYQAEIEEMEVQE